jgi:hypothetical protein
MIDRNCATKCSILRWFADRCSGIVRLVTSRQWWVLVGALGFAGCASSTDGARGGGGAGGGIRGGQTGSLTPACGVATAGTGTTPIPGGDATLVLYTADCPELATEDAVNLTDSAGNRLDVELVPLGDGKFLIRSSTMLAPGSYDVTLPGRGQTRVSVSDVAPLPTEIGSIRQVGSANCSADFALDLGLEARDYAPLLQLSVAIDGDDPVLWVDFGLLETAPGEARLRLPCSGACTTPGSHTITVTARIAGEDVEPEPLETAFFMECEPASSCAVAPRNPCGNFPASPFIAALCFGAPFIAALRRAARRRRRPFVPGKPCLNPQPVEPASLAAGFAARCR